MRRDCSAASESPTMCSVRACVRTSIPLLRCGMVRDLRIHIGEDAICHFVEQLGTLTSGPKLFHGRDY